jgi:hypothetical protein
MAKFLLRFGSRRGQEGCRETRDDNEQFDDDRTQSA